MVAAEKGKVPFRKCNIFKIIFYLTAFIWVTEMQI